VPGASGGPLSGAAAVTDSRGAVNVNTADAAAMDALPGIGPVLAQRIVDHRTQNGPFQRVEDLQEVPGIGPAIFARLIESVIV